jgi:hypothetical protein
MAIYFFCDHSLLKPQQASKCFGPIAGDESNKYRVCSLHEFTSDALAYSVTKGAVKIQPIGGATSELVNIILKPENPQFCPGLKIKYIIYRGIKKSSLISADTIAPSESNDLTANIWSNHIKSVQLTAGTPAAITGDPSNHILGWHLSNEDGNKSISLLFDQPSNFSTPVIEEGKSIGEFKAAAAGIEVVMEGYLLDDTLQSVRTQDHIIDISSLSDSFVIKSKREQVVNYLDISAFYGTSSSNGTTIKSTSNSDTTLNSEQLYTDVLAIKFINHEKCYLDIRDNGNLSFVYLKPTYEAKVFNLSIDEYTIQDSNYTSNHWPIHSFLTPPNFTAQRRNGIYSGLMNFGFERIATENNPTLIFPTTPLNWTIKFITPEVSLRGNPALILSSTKISISEQLKIVLNASHNKDGEPKLVSSYLRCNYYYNHLTSPQTESDSFPKIRPFDNMFALPIERPFGADNAGLYIYRSPLECFTQYEFNTNIKNVNVDPKPIGDDRIVKGIFDTYIAFEQNRVTFFALLKQASKVTGDFLTPNIIPEGRKGNMSLFAYLENLFKTEVRLSKHQVEIGTQKYPFLNFTQVFDKSASVSRPFLFFGVSISLQEYDQILSSKIATGLNENFYPLYIHLDNINIQDDNLINYQKATISLRGIKTNGDIINKAALISSIQLYSPDYLFFSPNSASQEQIQIVTYNGEEFKNLRVSLSDELQTALTNLSVQKQHLFDDLQKLEAFQKYAFKIARGTTAIKIQFWLATLSGALANTQVLYDQPGNKPSIVIRIDPTFLVKASSVAIIRTILHEMIHASIGYDVIKILGYALPIKFAETKPTQYKAAIAKIRSSKHEFGKIYADLICKFGDEDPHVPVNDSINERDYEHNFMAEYARIDIYNSAREYEIKNEIDRPTISITLRNKFPVTPPVTDITLEISKDDVYNALSWQGIEHTREFRHQASKDYNPVQAPTQPFHDVSYLKFQLYNVVANHEINATAYSLNVTISAFEPADYMPVANPSPKLCDKRN